MSALGFAIPKDSHLPNGFSYLHHHYYDALYQAVNALPALTAGQLAFLDLYEDCASEERRIIRSEKRARKVGDESVGAAQPEVKDPKVEPQAEPEVEPDDWEKVEKDSETILGAEEDERQAELREKKRREKKRREKEARKAAEKAKRRSDVKSAQSKRKARESVAPQISLNDPPCDFCSSNQLACGTSVQRRDKKVGRVPACDECDRRKGKCSLTRSRGSASGSSRLVKVTKRSKDV